MVKRILICGFLPFAGFISTACEESVSQADLTPVMPVPDIRFDLNKVSYDELISIDGIKRNVANNIIEFRKHCRFKRVQDLLAVKGIGETTFLLVRNHFYVIKPEG